MVATEVKDLARQLGADACGISAVAAWVAAPAGFHPNDVYRKCRSVIVFGKKLPRAVLHAASPIPYSMVDDLALQATHRIAWDLAIGLEARGLEALPVPAEPYEYWDAASLIGKGLLSLRHGAWLAGLGLIGRNGLLCHPEHGNLLKLGAVLCDGEFDPDLPLEGSFCAPGCRRCVEGCPSGALGGDSVIQAKCRRHAEGSTAKGAPITVCHACRSVCPHATGWARARD